MKTIKKHFKTNDELLKRLFAIAIPIALQSTVQSTLSLIDQMMIGKLGAGAIASVGLGHRVLFIFVVLLSGISASTSIYASQFFGSGEKKKISSIVGISLLLSMIISVLYIMGSFTIPSQFISIFTKDQEVIGLGVQYLKAISLIIIPISINLVYSSVLRSSGNTKLPMYCGILSVATNTLLNYLFIFGKMGFPAMGVAGAAYATVISRFIETLVMVFVIYNKELPAAIPIKDMFRGFDRKLFGVFIVTALPVVINEVSWVLGDSAFAVIYGRMGTYQLAALTLTYPVVGLTIGFLSGLSASAGVILGNYLGAGEHTKAYESSFRIIKIGIISSIVIGIVTSFMAQYYVGIYSVEPEVKRYTYSMLIIYSMIMWTKVSNMIIGGGVLRSGGNTKIVMIMEIIGMWGVGVPLGILSAYVWKLPVTSVYLIVATEEFARFFMGLYLVKTKKWIRNITSDIQEPASV